MKNREILEDQLEDSSAELKSLNCFIKELNTMTAEHGTDRAHFEEDLIEAEHNAQYYQSEIERLKKEIEESNTAKPVNIPNPVNSSKPGIFALVLSPISFLVGALLGSRLKSRRANKDS